MYILKNNNGLFKITNCVKLKVLFYFSFSDRAPSECSWDSNDDELRGSFSTDGDGKH